MSLKAMAQLQVRMHQIRTSNLRPLKPKLAAAIASAEQLDAGLKTRLLDRLADLPDGDSLCHGDFHPYNLIGSPEALTIIDWLDAASGPAAADICRTLVILALAGDEVAEAYLVQYLALSGLTREEVLAWRPIVAAARLRENPPAIEQLLDWAAAV